MASETTQSDQKDKQADMEIYQKLAVPGAPHELLAGMAGSWQTKSRCWMEPGKPPVESNGTCEQRMLLGGRYLQQDFAGNMMGMPFNGIGITGYDNHTKQYVSIWMDSMSTSIFYFQGSATPDGRTITQECHYSDPVRGPMTWRSVTRIVDDNTHLFEMYGTVQGGKEEQMMEITYTRSS